MVATQTYLPNGFPASPKKALEGRPELDQSILDLDRISQEILSADGNIAVVAEKILGNHALTNKILGAITADTQALDSFAIKVRAYALIKLIGIFSELSTSVMGQIGNLGAKDAVKALTEIGHVMNELSAKSAGPAAGATNNVAVMINTLPADVRKAMDILVDVQPDGTVVSKLPAGYENVIGEILPDGSIYPVGADS